MAQWAGHDDERGRWVRGRWLELRPRAADATNVHNDQMIRPFARKYADRELQSITEEDAQEFANQPSSLKEVHAMFNDAMRFQLVERNPFSSALQGASRRDPPDIVVLTDSELAVLSGIARAVHGDYGPVIAAMVDVAAWTGLRPGELFLLALEPGEQLNHVDVLRGEVHVNWQLNAKTGRVGQPKNDSRREVVLLPGAKRALLTLKGTVGPVFTTKRGKRFSPRTFFYYWNPVRKAFQAQLAPGHHLRARMDEHGQDGELDFYELRHFFGTKLAHPPKGIRAAHPHEIAELMGHKDGGQLAAQRYIGAEESDVCIAQRIAKNWQNATPTEPAGYFAEDREGAIDRAIVESYTRHPQEDLVGFDAAAKALIGAEPWDPAP